MSSTDSKASPTAALFAAMPFGAVLGLEDVDGDASEVRASAAWQPERCTLGGILHGGYLMAIADALGGACAFLNLPEGAGGTATIESKTNFLRPMSAGRVHGIARPLHVGRTTVVVDTELRDDAGRLVARTTQTQAVLPQSR